MKSDLKKEIESLYQFCKNNKEAVDRLNRIYDLIEQVLSSQREEFEKVIDDVERKWCRIINRQVRNNQKKTAEINLIQLICRELKSKLEMK